MYSQITANKRKTWVLVTLFSILIMAIFAGYGAYLRVEIIPLLIIGAIFSVGYCTIAFYASEMTVLLTHGAEEIDKQKSPELYRLVENLAITAGLPTPKIYVITDEAPNAFAAGRDPKHASITFTSGILKILNKTELEGVIAHEMSHIKNFDVRVMTIVVVLIGLILLLSDILLRSSIRMGVRGAGKKNTPWPAILIALALAILSPLIAQLIKFAVSRAREYLADADGALLTRHPDALASALEKMKNMDRPLRSANHATAHLFIANPFGDTDSDKTSIFAHLFSTHPPLAKRIEKLRTMGR